MGLWDDRILPRVIDRACGQKDLLPLRHRACAGLRGTVLELGFGSGLNTDLYPAAVERILVVEPSDAAWEMSSDRRAQASVPIERVGLDGARIDLGNASVDTVLSTFTLCTIPDVESALREARRVLRPGGTLHLAEHGAAPEPGVARWQKRLDPLQQRVFGGCHLTRDHRALLTGAGFVDLDVDTDYLPMPRLMAPWAYGYAGQARTA